MVHDIETFENTVEKTREWIREVKDELGAGTERQALSALRAVLHVLRDRLSVEEAVQLAAQLPLLMRGIYFEGWRPSGKPQRFRHLDEMLERVREGLRGRTEMDPERAVKAVFAVLARRVTPGELEDVRHNLSRELGELIPR